MLGDFLISAYPWTKSLHVVSVISWMAGLFYLPRLYVYHAERAKDGSELDQTFQVMERRLMKAIMVPAMVASWIFGLGLVFTPGVISWEMVWPWLKAFGVIGMTAVHFWLAARGKDFARNANTRTGRTYRIMNEAPTLLMLIIVFMVIGKPF